MGPLGRCDEKSFSKEWTRILKWLELNTHSQKWLDAKHHLRHGKGDSPIRFVSEAPVTGCPPLIVGDATAANIFLQSGDGLRKLFIIREEDVVCATSPYTSISTGLKFSAVHSGVTNLSGPL